MVNFDAEKFESLAERFVARGIFVTAGGGSVRVMAREAATFFGLPYGVLLTALGGNTERWFTYLEGLKDGYQGKPGRAINLDYVVGWKQGWLDKLWDSQKGGRA